MFHRDSVAFTNETRWVYEFDTRGRMHARRREPEPEYSLRCFALSRLMRQFHDHARFEPQEARPDAEEVRRLVREVTSRSARCPSPPAERVEIPGFVGLRELSVEHGILLMEEGGGASESYFQRGNWRMILPFGPRHQESVARRMAEDLRDGRPRVVHIVRFPRLSINHAVLVYAARRTSSGWEFDTADPNDPSAPRQLRFDEASGRFAWPRAPYFPGGRVDVYEVYRGAWY